MSDYVPLADNLEDSLPASTTSAFKERLLEQRHLFWPAAASERSFQHEKSDAKVMLQQIQHHFTEPALREALQQHITNAQAILHDDISIQEKQRKLATEFTEFKAKARPDRPAEAREIQTQAAAFHQFTLNQLLYQDASPTSSFQRHRELFEYAVKPNSIEEALKSQIAQLDARLEVLDKHDQELTLKPHMGREGANVQGGAALEAYISHQIAKTREEKERLELLQKKIAQLTLDPALQAKMEAYLRLVHEHGPSVAIDYANQAQAMRQELLQTHEALKPLEESLAQKATNTLLLEELKEKLTAFTDKNPINAVYGDLQSKQGEDAEVLSHFGSIGFKNGNPSYSQAYTIHPAHHFAVFEHAWEDYKKLAKKSTAPKASQLEDPTKPTALGTGASLALAALGPLAGLPILAYNAIKNKRKARQSAPEMARVKPLNGEEVKHLFGRVMHEVNTTLGRIKQLETRLTEQNKQALPDSKACEETRGELERQWQALAKQVSIASDMLQDQDNTVRQAIRTAATDLPGICTQLAALKTMTNGTLQNALRDLGVDSDTRNSQKISTLLTALTEVAKKAPLGLETLNQNAIDQKDSELKNNISEMANALVERLRGKPKTKEARRLADTLQKMPLEKLEMLRHSGRGPEALLRHFPEPTTNAQLAKLIDTRKAQMQLDSLSTAFTELDQIKALDNLPTQKGFPLSPEEEQEVQRFVEASKDKLGNNMIIEFITPFQHVERPDDHDYMRASEFFDSKLWARVDKLAFFKALSREHKNGRLHNIQVRFDADGTPRIVARNSSGRDLDAAQALVRLLMGCSKDSSSVLDRSTDHKLQEDLRTAMDPTTAMAESAARVDSDVTPSAPPATPEDGSSAPSPGSTGPG